MPFVIKNLISHLLHPVPMLFVIGVLAVVLLYFRRTRSMAKGVFSFGVVLFLVFGFGLLNPLLEHLETRHPPFDGRDASLCENLRGAAIMVFGQGLADEHLPSRFGVNDCFQHRLAEAAYVAHCIPESRLVISVSGDAAIERKREAIESFSTAYGLPIGRIDWFAEARDTAEEVRDAKPFIGARKVVAVTSASHMPRTLRIFASAEIDAVPAPCEYRYFGGDSKFTWKNWHFGTHNFDRAERVIHEGVGLLYEKMKGSRSM